MKKLLKNFLCHGKIKSTTQVKDPFKSQINNEGSCLTRLDSSYDISNGSYGNLNSLDTLYISDLSYFLLTCK